MGYQLRRASAVVMADLSDTLRPYDFKPASASVLVMIAESPKITPSQLGRLLNIKRSNMAPITNELETSELVSRVAIDGRSHGLVVTSEGQELVDRIQASILAHEQRFQSLYTDEELETLFKLLPRLWASSED